MLKNKTLLGKPSDDFLHAERPKNKGFNLSQPQTPTSTRNSTMTIEIKVHTQHTVDTNSV